MAGNVTNRYHRVIVKPSVRSRVAVLKSGREVGMKFDRSLLPLLLPIGAVAIAATVLVGAVAQDTPAVDAASAPAPVTRIAAATAPIVPVSAQTPVTGQPSPTEPHPIIPPAPVDRAPPPAQGNTATAPPAAAASPPAQAPTSAQAPAAPTPQAPRFSRAELEQLLAPIALYPDQLLSQVLMASTYPLEVVEAARWVSVRANRALKGDALVAALRDKHWEPSVMALVPFPHILELLCAQLEWTQKLGNAFLAQQADVMDAVQRLRKAAIAAGRFQTGPQCRCVVATNDHGYVTVAPAQPRMVYVPVYDPVWVYGAWPYPAYPPVVFPLPVGFAWYAPGVYFGFWGGVDVAFYGPLWGWGNFAWGAHGIFVDPVRVALITGGAVALASTTWVHDPVHRGVIGGIGGARAAAFHVPVGARAVRAGIIGRSFARGGHVGAVRGFGGPARRFTAGPAHAFRGFGAPHGFGRPHGFGGPRGGFAGGFHGFGGGRAHMAFAGGGHGFGGGHGHR